MNFETSTFERAQMAKLRFQKVSKVQNVGNPDNDDCYFNERLKQWFLTFFP